MGGNRFRLSLSISLAFLGWWGEECWDYIPLYREKAEWHFLFHLSSKRHTFLGDIGKRVSGIRMLRDANSGFGTQIKESKHCPQFQIQHAAYT